MKIEFFHIWIYGNQTEVRLHKLIFIKVFHSHEEKLWLQSVHWHVFRVTLPWNRASALALWPNWKLTEIEEQFHSLRWSLKQRPPHSPVLYYSYAGFCLREITISGVSKTVLIAINSFSTWQDTSNPCTDPSLVDPNSDQLSSYLSIHLSLDVFILQPAPAAHWSFVLMFTSSVVLLKTVHLAED